MCCHDARSVKWVAPVASWASGPFSVSERCVSQPRRRLDSASQACARDRVAMNPKRRSHCLLGPGSAVVTMYCTVQSVVAVLMHSAPRMDWTVLQFYSSTVRRIQQVVELAARPAPLPSPPLSPLRTVLLCPVLLMYVIRQRPFPLSPFPLPWYGTSGGPS